MNIMLLNPPTLARKGESLSVFPPVGLLYIASYLKAQLSDISVSVVDAVVDGYPACFSFKEKYLIYGLSDDDLKAKIAELKPDIVGLTCMFTNQHEAVLQAARLVKEVQSEILVVIGGSHATAVADELLQHQQVDVVVRGPGEELFLSVVQCFKDHADFKRVPSVAYRENDGRIVVKPIVVSDVSLDDLPPPDFSLVNVDMYHKLRYHMPTPSVYKALPISLSRGCPNKCIFCYVSAVWGTSIRHRSIENIRSEIRDMRERYGVEELHILDDNFGFFKEFSLEFMRMARQEGIRKIVPFNGSPIRTLLDDEFLDELQKLDVDCLRIYPESVSSDTLRKMHKPQNLQMIKKIMETAKSRDMITFSCFIIGFPWQTISEMESEARMDIELASDFSYFSALNALPGTKLYKQCKADGILAPEVCYSDISLNSGNISTANFTCLDVERIAKQAYISSNFSSSERISRGARIFKQTPEQFMERKKRAEFFLAEVEKRIKDGSQSQR